MKAAWIHHWRCNELCVGLCCFDENNLSLTEIEAGPMKKILSKYIFSG